MDDENINMLLGKTVCHAKFGNGIITFITERKYIEVYFPDIEEEKSLFFQMLLLINLLSLLISKLSEKTNSGSLEEGYAARGENCANRSASA